MLLIKRILIVAYNTHKKCKIIVNVMETENGTDTLYSNSN